MIDLHCHLLPGIDDGPKTMEQALAMARFAVEQGIVHCVLTPHIHPGCYDNTAQSIQLVFDAFKRALNDAGIALEISMAAEVRVCAELPVLVMQNKIPYLGKWQDNKVILLEFPHNHIPIGVEKLVQWLLDRKIIPLIAHPERNQALMKQPAKIDRFLAMGCLLQVTAGSITGLFGLDSQRTALHYIEQGKVTVIATDAHNLHKRQPSLLAARQVLSSLIDADEINQLILANPRQIMI